MPYYPSLDYITIDGDNAFSVNFAGDLQYLLKLEPERMLYNFKSAFGVETSAEPIYGWDAPDGLLRGHSTGHFLSALAIAYSATGDSRFKEKLSYMVGELRKLQLMSGGASEKFTTACTPEDCAQDKWSRDPSVWGEGFLSAYSPDQFALLEQFTPYAKIWAPYYTLHKILAGLIEAYERCGLDEALSAAEGIGGWVYRRLSVLSPEHRAKMWSMYIAGEYGGMNESLARLALLTGKKEFMDCARMFDNANIFPGLEEGEDVIKRLHANQHIPQIMGAVMEYRATGEVKYLKIAKNFFDIVKNHHMYAIGGVGQGECFREPDELAHFIKGDTNCETCATYNMIKLARELYALSLPFSETTAAGYMDYIERGLYNHILASRNPNITDEMTNGVTYMLPIGPGAEKSYTDDYYSFTCCHGTGMENHVKYGDCLYYVGDGAVYVNEYVPSTLSEGDLVIQQEIDFPSLEGRIVVKSAVPLVVKLRIPAWAEGNPFSVGGKPAEVDGRYSVIDVDGGDETVVDVKFSFTPRLEYLPDLLSEYDEHMVNRDTHYHDDNSRKPDEELMKSLSREPKDRVCALMYGPFVMCARAGGSEFLRIPAGTDFIPACDGSVALYGAGIAFRPIYALHGEPYHAYFVSE